VTAAFFDDFQDLLDRLATFSLPVYVVGDFNIHFEQRENGLIDPHAAQLIDDLSAHGLSNRVQSATRGPTGIIDIVATRDDLPVPHVDVRDVGLSDHHLLHWSAPLRRGSPVYKSVVSRPWKRLDCDSFRVAVQTSALCCPEDWPDNIDALAALYNDEIAAILDRQLPSRKIRCRQRASDPWFDDDCRVAKRCVRLFERDLRRIRRVDRDNIAAIDAATAVWHARRRQYRELLHQKRETFWRTRVTNERSSPRQLWRSIDTLLGRGRVPLPSVITADAAHAFFEAKVAGVRASTDNSPPPSFTAAPAGCSFDGFRPLTVADVTAAVHQLPDKQCTADPLPTRLLKENIDLLAPFLVELFNRSLTCGSVSQIFKAACVTPLLKKPNLDSVDVKSYRPISNLPVLSQSCLSVLSLVSCLAISQRANCFLIYSRRTELIIAPRQPC